MKYTIIIKRHYTYEIEASSRAEAYNKAKTRKAVMVAPVEEAISIQEKQ